MEPLRINPNRSRGWNKHHKSQVYFSPRQYSRFVQYLEETEQDQSGFIRRLIMDEVDTYLEEKEKNDLKLQALRKMAAGGEV